MTPKTPETDREVALRGAIARGWCHDKNAAKEMDADLADAIFREVLALLRRDAPREGASEAKWRAAVEWFAAVEASLTLPATPHPDCEHGVKLLDEEAMREGRAIFCTPDRAPREGGEAADLSAFLPAVKLWRAWAELGEFAEKIGPVSFRKPVEEYQRRIAEADRLLALIAAHRPQPAMRSTGPVTLEEWRDLANTLGRELDALRPQPAGEADTFCDDAGVRVPDGWVLVPREPTPEMIAAACDACILGECYYAPEEDEDWRDAIRAAIAASTQEGG